MELDCKKKEAQMRCTSPRTVGFQPDGKTLCWSPKKYSKEFATFQIPCGKCISCRLESARQTAVRCIHEAQQYENNSFITLTYSDENLKSPKLKYQHFQQFIKKLRSKIQDDYLKEKYPGIKSYDERKEKYKSLEKEDQKWIQENIRISVFVTGEYGDKNKRPHWHAIIFNYKFRDAKHYRTTDRGDKIYTSKDLDKLWGHNDPEKRPNEIGDVTIDSAGYVARYATKKLYHGRDGEHDYNPISRRSSKHAIGKKWIEKYYKQVFNQGFVTFKNSKGDVIKCGIPRYYEKWLKNSHPEIWKIYVTGLKSKIISQAISKEKEISLEEKQENFKKAAIEGLKMVPVKTMKKMKNEILLQYFNKQKENLKL